MALAPDKRAQRVKARQANARKKAAAKPTANQTKARTQQRANTGKFSNSKGFTLGDSSQSEPKGARGAAARKAARKTGTSVVPKSGGKVPAKATGTSVAKTGGGKLPTAAQASKVAGKPVKRVLGKIGKKAALAAAAKAGAKMAARFIPGIGWALLAYDAIDYLSKVGDKQKNPASQGGQMARGKKAGTGKGSPATKKKAAPPKPTARPSAKNGDKLKATTPPKPTARPKRDSVKKYDAPAKKRVGKSDMQKRDQAARAAEKRRGTDKPKDTVTKALSKALKDNRPMQQMERDRRNNQKFWDENGPDK